MDSNSIMSIRRHWIALPKLIRFLLTHFADGAALGGLIFLALLWLDIAGIGSLLDGEDSSLLTVLLLGQFCIFFGTVTASIAVLCLKER